MVYVLCMWRLLCTLGLSLSVYFLGVFLAIFFGYLKCCSLSRIPSFYMVLGDAEVILAFVFWSYFLFFPFYNGKNMHDFMQLQSHFSVDILLIFHVCV